MRSLRFAAHVALLITAPSVGVAAQESAVSGVVVRSHTVAPAQVEMGARAWERLTLWAPDGVQLRVQDGASSPDDVERLGSWSVVRAPESGGGVLWSFDIPFLAWSSGDHATPRIRVGVWRDQRVVAAFDVEGVPFPVTSPLPDETRRFAPAPAEGPLDPGPVWPGFLAVLPLTLALGSGIAWWRTDRRQLDVSGAPSAAKPPPPGIEAVLARPPERPAELAVAVADAVRAHPALAERKVRDALTTGEILALAGPSLDGIAEILALADGVKYGGTEPDAERVDAAVRAAVEALGHG